MDKRILRENDIRGKYPKSLNEEVCNNPYVKFCMYSFK